MQIFLTHTMSVSWQILMWGRLLAASSQDYKAAEKKCFKITFEGSD